ncbi:hypothetical protein SAMN05444342_3703 [Haladaptatus paucihalophilus DX253]|uniref:Uncharacterized protein n=1 Tax=Haladaptatus paucihalophilus DX253 TaxID=797209 RepID=A0A1M7A4R1_HALPU|nr:hypothetical protein SAMN05444342_3703 [Haladaptatus paucihalophilus DX253]
MAFQLCHTPEVVGRLNFIDKNDFVSSCASKRKHVLNGTEVVTDLDGDIKFLIELSYNRSGAILTKFNAASNWSIESLVIIGIV